MEPQETMILNKIKKVFHWIALIAVVYIFGYAGLYKILGVPSMVAGMAEIGFDSRLTFLIGVAETVGVVGVIAGLYYPKLKIVSLILLLPLAIGAFTVHLSYHHPFSVYLNSLLVCIAPVVILWTDDKFRISLD